MVAAGSSASLSRTCRFCDAGIEDTNHILKLCPRWNCERAPLVQYCKDNDDYDTSQCLLLAGISTLDDALVQTWIAYEQNKGEPSPCGVVRLLDRFLFN